MAQGHLTITEIRGVDLILSQAQKSMDGVPFYFGSHVNNATLGLRIGSIAFRKSPTYRPVTNLSERIAKQVLCQSDSDSKQEPSVRTLWLNTRMMVSPTKLTVHFAKAETVSLVRQSKSLEDREIGKQFAALWKVLAEKLKVLFPDGNDTGPFIDRALDIRSQVLSIKDRSNGVGKSECKLALSGNGQLFALTASDLHVPGILDTCCNRSSLKPARPLCDGRSFVPPAFSPPGGSRALFRRFPFSMGFTFFALSGSILDLAVRNAMLQGKSSVQMRPPARYLSCFFVAALWLRQSQFILIQVQQTNDIDWTCHKTLPTKSVTCLQSGSMSHEWPVAPIACRT